MTIPLADDAATQVAGAKLAGHLRGGETIALVGDLGAGKTTFAKGLVAALGARAGASSPTFALVNEYRGGRLIVWHLDLYRIERERELDELGLSEMIGNSSGVTLIEWADRFPYLLPGDHLRIELAHSGAARTLNASGAGRAEVLASALAAELLGSST